MFVVAQPRSATVDVLVTVLGRIGSEPEARCRALFFRHPRRQPGARREEVVLESTTTPVMGRTSASQIAVWTASI